MVSRGTIRPLIHIPWRKHRKRTKGVESASMTLWEKYLEWEKPYLPSKKDVNV